MSPETSGPVSLSVKVAVWITTVLSVISGAGSLFIGWEHGREADWTAHQRSHAIWSSGQGAALCLLIIVLAWIPFRRGERWSWYALLVATLGQHGALVLGYVMTGWKSHLQTAPELGAVFLVAALAALAAAAPFFWRARA